MRTTTARPLAFAFAAVTVLAATEARADLDACDAPPRLQMDETDLKQNWPSIAGTWTAVEDDGVSDTRCYKKDGQDNEFFLQMGGGWYFVYGYNCSEMWDGIWVGDASSLDGSDDFDYVHPLWPGAAHWNDLSAYTTVTQGDTASIHINGSPVTVSYSSAFSGNFTRAFTPPNAVDGGFEASWGATLGWEGPLSYVDLKSPAGSVTGTITWEFEATAEEVFGPGWAWVVATAGTSGDGSEGPTAITPSTTLSPFGRQDAFATGRYADFDGAQVIGSENSDGGWLPDGYRFFYLPADAQSLTLNIDDGGRYDPHGYVVGAVEISECVIP